MKVVFLEDVPGTARIGDIKDVKPGFARNYLLPRRLAMPATPAIVKSAEQRAAREARLQDARDNEARTLAEKLEGVTYTITAKAGSDRQALRLRRHRRHRREGRRDARQRVRPPQRRPAGARSRTSATTRSSSS